MKRQVQVAWLLFLWVVLLPARAQLGTVNLNNNFVPPGYTAKAFLLGFDGNPLPKGLWKVEVLDRSGAIIKSVPLGANGLFFFGAIEIPRTHPGGTAFVTLRGWDWTTGATFDEATIKGSTYIRLHNLGGGGLPPPPLATAGDFVGAYFPCAFCPVWNGTDRPPALLVLWMIRGGPIQLRGELMEGPWFWRLQISQDLENWTPFGEAVSGPFAEWTIANQPSSQFFRVVQEPMAP